MFILRSSHFLLPRIYDMKPVEQDATLECNKFICKDFLISTSLSNIGYVTKSGTKVDVRRDLLLFYNLRFAKCKTRRIVSEVKNSFTTVLIVF
jgi:hypothetical protein